jgi:ABC-2 type transport system ATP-binding protein
MIRINDVSKSFGKVRALDGVSLQIEAGEKVALVGTNGSGKTTLMRAMCGLLRVEGQVTIEDVDLARAPERALEHLAYVPQIAPPLDAPVRELVRAYGALRKLPQARVVEHLRAFGLAFDSIARARVRDLSGGTKQKLLLSLALSTDASILVCDEPTASLDEAARATFFGLIRARPANTTLVLCSHRSDEVYGLVERVIELAEGKLARDQALEPSPTSKVSNEANGCLRKVG